MARSSIGTASSQASMPCRLTIFSTARICARGAEPQRGYRYAAGCRGRDMWVIAASLPRRKLDPQRRQDVVLPQAEAHCEEFLKVLGIPAIERFKED
jgi:hypothetical protein